MPKEKTKAVFVCESCGTTFPKWTGQCQNCGEWNTLVEQLVSTSAKKAREQGSRAYSVIAFPDIEPTEGVKNRISTHIPEFDRVLGGSDSRLGIVPGAVMVIGGEPGIGKSTLLTQLVIELALSSSQTSPILYCCGEESPSQIRLRVKRLLEDRKEEVSEDQLRRIVFLASTDVDEICQVVRDTKPLVAIVDSIQTVTTYDLQGSAGSPGQLRECADRLTKVAKQTNVPLFIVGHVTKEGTLAGPKLLEHIVDSVLELSGERSSEIRLLRAVKNRFGATDEVGVFCMSSEGLRSVTNPSELFLSKIDEPVSGSVTACTMEGTRPLLVEVQSLVVPSRLAMPRRVGRGVTLSRIQIICAILQKHAGIPIDTCDVFISVAGGMELKEPAIDLAIAVALASSFSGKVTQKELVCIGELGLLGEVRRVPSLEKRVGEAVKLGYSSVVTWKECKRIKDVLKMLKI